MAEDLLYPEEEEQLSRPAEEEREPERWGELLSEEEKAASQRSLLAQMFLRFADWPLLAPEEEVRLMATYHVSLRHLGPIAEATGLTEEEVLVGIRKAALRSLGLGESLGPGLSMREVPKGVRMDYQRVYEGQEAWARLVLSNARLVVSLAKRHASKWPAVPLEDLIQEGFAGLIKAIDRFDLSLKTKLSTYATWWIRDALGKAVKRHVFAHRIEGAEGEGSLAQVLSIDEEMGDDGDRYAETIPAPEREEPPWAEEEEVQERLKAALKRLAPRDLFVLMSRYGLFGFKPMSQAELAAKLGVSETRVRQIEARAHESLARILRESGLGDDPLAWLRPGTLETASEVVSGDGESEDEDEDEEGGAGDEGSAGDPLF